MYIVTFYSFKGGLGRTMAMANVGLSLAKAGRRVLLVDFDLEAPGLDTFNLLRPSRPTPGLVDFVTEYRTTRVAPDLTQFVYEPSHAGIDAKIWVMPTGRQDTDYGARLNAIDWPQLYAQEDGYLLFEDLKQQWCRALSPDYVFIDSRTGHTDVGGICTRQLPNAVVLLFAPNEQNRRGLEVVVRDINREAQESGRTIQKYFVAANIPNLDDEYGILANELGHFQPIMQQPTPDATIHHYDSLLLLQQTIFTLDRPRTKLATEYERLATIITSSNLDDRTVVTDFLHNLSRGRTPLRLRSPERIDERLKDIKRLYAFDGAILYALGQAHRSLGRDEDAEHLFAEAEGVGFLSEEKLAEQASKAYLARAPESARELVRKALDLTTARVDLTTTRVFGITRLLSVIVKHDVGFLPEALGALDAKGIDAEDKIYIATRLEVQRNALAAIADFLRPLAISSHPIASTARGELSLCLIGQRRFVEARELILSAGAPSELEIQDSFNYAMALWGETGKIPTDQFAHVVALDLDSARPGIGANYLQCLAIAHWAVGRSDVARDLTAKSRSAVNGKDLEFSAWRYLRVSREQFRRDLDSLDVMITTGKGRPVMLDDQGEPMPG